MQDDDGEQFVAYFIPTVETLQKKLTDREEGKSYTEGAVYEHTLSREYTWTVKNKNTKGFERDNYFVYYKDGCFHYNELETKVKLARRRRNAHEKVGTGFFVSAIGPLWFCFSAEYTIKYFVHTANRGWDTADDQ